MPISGPNVHRELMQAYTNAQERLSIERDRVSSVGGERAQLHASRERVLSNLAEHYLPELTADAVRDTWVEVRGSIASVLLRKEDRCREVRESLAKTNQLRLELEKRLNEINDELDKAKLDEQDLSAKLEAVLHQNSHFVDLAEKAAIAEAALERAEANLQEIDQDAARKLPAFNESSLFRYLYDRKFGTKEYAHRGFTRRMDRTLAKYIDYQKARQSYEFLKQTPEHMREIIAQDREALDTVMTAIEKMRDEEAGKMGLPVLMDRIDDIEARRSQQIATLEEVASETQQHETELTQLEHPKGPFYREAIDLFRDMLSKTDSRDLRIRAAETPQITDDQIVATIMGVEDELENLDDRVQQQRLTIEHMQEMMDSLGKLIQRFRALRFDSSRSQFVGTLDVTTLLLRARDRRDVEDAWEQIRSAQRWGPTTMEKISNVAAHPMTQVLINAMVHAAGEALESHARRAGERRRRSRQPWDSSGSWSRRR